MCQNFLVVQWLRLCPSTAGGTGSILSQGTTILHATQHSQKKKRPIYRDDPQKMKCLFNFCNPQPNLGRC